MKAISKLRFHTGLDLSTVKSLVAEARDAALREARSCGQRHIASRGTWLCTLDRKGDQCYPNIEANCPVWKGSQREIEKLLDEVIKHHTDVGCIYISGGYDSADSLRDYLDGTYDPWASSWSVEIWKRKD